MTTRIAATGGRDYTDREVVWVALDQLRAKHPDLVLVHGAARGADTLAAEWAAERGVPAEAFAADWKRFGRGAGPERNARMAGSGLTGLVAFPGGKGTTNMIAECERRGVPVWRP